MKSKLMLILLVILVLVCCIGLCGCYDDSIVASAATNANDYYEYNVNLIREPITLELESEYEGDTYYTAVFVFDNPITLVDGGLYYINLSFSGLSTTGYSSSSFYYDNDENFVFSSTFDSYFYIVLHRDYNVTDSYVSNMLEVTYSGTTWTEGSTCTLNELSLLVNGGGSFIGSSPTSTWYNYIIQVDRITLPMGSPSNLTSNLSSAFNNSMYSYDIVESDINLYKSYSFELLNGSLGFGSNDIYGRYDFELVGTSSSVITTPSWNYVFNPNALTGSSAQGQSSSFYTGSYTWIGTGLDVPDDLSFVYGDDSFIYLTPCYFNDSQRGMFFSVSLPYPLNSTNDLGYRITDNFTGLTFDSTVTRPVNDVNSALIPLSYTLVDSFTSSTPSYPTSAYDNYNEGYNEGYEDGLKIGGSTASKESYDRGYYNGVRDGILKGAEEQPYTFISMLSSVIDAPLQVFKGMFNLDVLGVNLTGFFLGLMSCCAILAIIRMFMK